MRALVVYCHPKEGSSIRRCATPSWAALSKRAWRRGSAIFMPRAFSRSSRGRMGGL